MKLNRPGKITGVFVLFSLLTLIATYPLIFKINSSIPGFFSTDEPFSVLWHYWWLKFSFINHIPETFCNFVAYPFGIDFSGNLNMPVWSTIFKYLSIFTNEIFAYNIMLISSFILSGFLGYYLVEYLTGSYIIGIFAGFAYTFLPYHFVRSWQHPSLALIELIPLAVIFLLKLYELKKIRYAIFLGLAIALSVHLNTYYAFFLFLACVLFILMIFFKSFILWLKKKPPILSLKLIKLFLIAAIVTIVLSLPVIISNFKFINLINKKGTFVSAWSVSTRPFEDLFTQSARPLSYFLPSAQNPIFGKFTEFFIGSKLYGDSYTEHTLYLGWTLLILAFVAFRKRRYLKDNNPGKAYAIDFFIWLVIAFWFISQPPWWKIFGFKLYMPSYFFYKFLPAVRAYCRAGIVVMLGIIVLSGFSVKYFLDKIKVKSKQRIFLIMIFSLLTIEFLNIPWQHNLDLSKAPGVYSWLKEQPKDSVIAEYPLDINGPNPDYQFYQTKHNKRMVNCTIPGSEANRVAKTMVELSNPATIFKLNDWGVGYIILHLDKYTESELLSQAEELERIRNSNYLTFFKKFPNVEVYRIK